MEKLKILLLTNKDEIDITNSSDIVESEVSTKEVEISGNDTLETLHEIRDLQEVQTSYIVFFVVIVLGGYVVNRLMKFLQSFFY